MSIPPSQAYRGRSPFQSSRSTQNNNNFQRGESSRSGAFRNNRPSEPNREWVDPRIINLVKTMNQSAGSIETMEQTYEQFFATNTGLKPNTYVWNVRIKAYCKAKKIDFALTLFGQMAQKNIAPDTVTYNTLIDGLCKANKVGEAKRQFQHMQTAKIQPDAVIYSLLIDVYTLTSQLEKAKELFKQQFPMPSGTDKINLHGVLSLGAGFIKVLLFLEQPNCKNEVTVITGWGKHSKIDDFQKMYNFVQESLVAHYKQLGTTITITEVEGNDGRFVVSTGKE